MQGKCSSALLAGIFSVAMMAASDVTATPQFSGLYLFGDSLSDTGNTEIAAPGGDLPNTDFTYGSNGRFSNGPIWAEYLSGRLGLGALEPSRAGGSNYAHGGAELDNRDGESRGLLTQLATFTNGPAAGGADPDALYVVWAGANDLRGAMVPNTDVPGLLGERIANYQTVLGTLIAHGAENLLVPGIPNLGRTPEARMAGISDEATQLVLQWNAAVAGMVQQVAAQTGASIWYYDVFGFAEDMFIDPAAYGLTNITEPCGTGFDETACANPDQYVFWDAIHPTTVGHRLIAEGAWRVLNESAEVPLPGAIWLLIPGLAGIAWRRVNARTA